jgi:hypothetical protein
MQKNQPSLFPFKEGIIDSMKFGFVAFIYEFENYEFICRGNGSERFMCEY